MALGSPASPRATTRFASDFALGALVFLAHARSLGCGFVWDDHENILGNPHLGSVRGLWAIWSNPHSTQQYYPLTHTSFWLNHLVGQTNPFGYHLVNVMLGALAAVMLRRVLLRLEVPGAFIGALLFGLHPSSVESIAWVTERKNVLSAPLALASVLAYLRFSGIGAGASRTWKTYARATGWFALALLAKTVTVMTAPALIVLVIWKKRRIVARDLWPLGPWMLVGGAFASLTASLEIQQLGARFDWPISFRLALAGRVFWHYLGELAWPLRLVFIAPRWSIDPHLPLAWVPLIAAVALYALLFGARRTLGSGALVAMALYGIAILPASGFFNVVFMRFTYVQSHFAYFASMPIFALVGASLARLGKRAAFPLSRAVFVAPIAASYALLTLQETRSYRDLETLFLDTVAKNPDAWMAQYNLGVVAAERGDLTTAIARYREALRTQPDDVFIVTNLGDLLVETGHADEGLALLRRGVALDPVNPIALQALANRLRSTGHAREAAETYRAVLRVQPGAQRPTLSLAALIASARDPSVGSPTEAVALLEPFCPKLKKLRAECLDDLSLAYQSAGRREDALRAAEEALASPTISEARAKRIRERIESDRKAP